MAHPNFGGLVVEAPWIPPISSKTSNGTPSATETTETGVVPTPRAEPPRPAEAPRGW